MDGEPVSFKVKKSGGALVDLATYAETDTQGNPAVWPGDRPRTYALSQGRAVEGDEWGVFGDGREQPSTLTLSLTLKRRTTRAWQRQAIDELEALALDAVALQNLYDGCEYALREARVTQERPTERSYVIELTLWLTGARTALGSVVEIPPYEPPTGTGAQEWRTMEWA